MGVEPSCLNVCSLFVSPSCSWLLLVKKRAALISGGVAEEEEAAKKKVSKVDFEGVVPWSPSLATYCEPRRCIGGD